MLILSPPPHTPRVAVAERPNGRLRFRMNLVLLASATVLLTAWFCTMGAIPGVIAVIVAKHILVALLAMGVGIDRRRTAPVD